ncbi:hypothetical protein EDB83DRAFT_2557491 [Lactarius deliciosus]|nr:hypothetical protein EDB83DRAFT_2557491 [Lactarius deliciosus]
MMTAQAGRERKWQGCNLRIFKAARKCGKVGNGNGTHTSGLHRTLLDQKPHRVSPRTLPRDLRSLLLTHHIILGLLVKSALKDVQELGCEARKVSRKFLRNARYRIWGFGDCRRVGVQWLKPHASAAKLGMEIVAPQSPGKYG